VAGVAARPRLSGAARLGAFLLLLPVLLVLWVLPVPASAADDVGLLRWVEPSLGLGIGPSIPLDQDLKVKLHDAIGDEIEHFFSDDVQEDLGPFVSLFATVWGRPGWTRYFGVQGELAYWSTTTTGGNWVDRQNHGNPDPVPPYERFDQHRLALIASLLGRVPVGFSGREMRRRPQLFAGFGMAGVWADVERGYSGWRWGLQAIAGGSVGVSERLRLRLDVRYLVAPDADATPSTHWTVDTSGAHDTFPYMSHYDTAFVVVQLGVELLP